MIFVKIKKIWSYLSAQFIAALHYDKKYLCGKYFFGGKHYGIGAIGWRWVVEDYHGCKKMNKNINVPWPVSPLVTVVKPENIEFEPDDLNNFHTFGTYFQAIGKIVIGKGTWIAPNVGLITANHSLNDLNKHDSPKAIILGRACWVGMNSVILPGVTLGDRTIVGAGSVVTKSFPDGHCVIAGNPARIIRILEE